MKIYNKIYDKVPTQAASNGDKSNSINMSNAGIDVFLLLCCLSNKHNKVTKNVENIK